MTRQAVAVALLTFLAAAPLAARPVTSKAVYTCGTDAGRAKRTEGRLETWSLASLAFTPDIRTLKPLRIRYKSITRIEFGPRPADRAKLLLDGPCPAERQDHYLTIFYKDVQPDGEEQADNPDDQDSRDARDAREKKFEKKYGKDPDESNDSKEQRDAKDEKRARNEKPLPQSEYSKERQEREDRRDRRTPTDLRDPKSQEEQEHAKFREKEKEREKEKARQKEQDKEHIAVFVLAEGELRPTLRIIETRSGKRVGYQDVAARKAAR